MKNPQDRESLGVNLEITRMSENNNITVPVLRTSEELGLLAKALVKFHKDLKPAIKSSENPFFHSRYASLDSIYEASNRLLSECGIACVQPLGTSINGKPCIITLIIHEESGEFIRSEFELNPPSNDPQKMGSYITYMRRYSFSAAFRIATGEDDDGNAASQPQPLQYREPSQVPNRYLASEKQINAIHSMWAKSGLKADLLPQQLKNMFGKISLCEISNSQASELIVKLQHMLDTKKPDLNS